MNRTVGHRASRALAFLLASLAGAPSAASQSPDAPRALPGAGAEAEGGPGGRRVAGAVLAEGAEPLGEVPSDEAPRVVVIELAGNALGSYPYFEYVRAFHEGGTVELAIDPTRHPQVAARAADVYVVASRTREEWAVRRDLVDVRGLPGVATFGGGSIRAATVLVDGGTLAADAGTELGVGYDLVVDLDRDGYLTDGDFIDGYDRQAGFFVVRDTTRPGPLAVVETSYFVESGPVAGFRGQNTFYPADIATRGELPLVVVSHGNGHNFRWYDHIGRHLASWGCVVVSHQNNTQPGIQTSAATTLRHTEAVIRDQAIIEGGVLDGHIDASCIVWIGHSRGGEGIVRAYTRLETGGFVSPHFDADDIVLMSSIAPTVFQPAGQVKPEKATFHLWTGGADNDVSLCPSCKQCESFRLHDRARGIRLSTFLHGAGHGAFHNGGGPLVAAGPCLLDRPTTHAIMRGYLLPLVKHFAEGSVPAKDFLWRQTERFAPPGVPADPCVVVDLGYRDDPAQTGFTIDHFQTSHEIGVSSSGGAVTLTVDRATEDVTQDRDNSLSHDPTDAMNGMTWHSPLIPSRALTFEWERDGQYVEFEIVPGRRDFSRAAYLSFRACQMTRHPLTQAELGDTTFTVALRDEDGRESAIGIGAYGGGLEEPYARVSCGVGVGWSNAFETIRIRLADFLTDGTRVDLSRIEAVTLLFGPSYGSAVGRIAIDDLELTLN